MTHGARTHTSVHSPGAGRRTPGLWLGVVTDNDDPKKLGRVRVRVPEIGGQKDLAWARVPTVLGGKGTGLFAPPENGTQVHVAFEADDVNRPVVMGAGWVSISDESNAPLAARAETDDVRDARGQDTATGAQGVKLTEPQDPSAPTYPDNRLYKGVSGHLIEVDDTPGAERISITHGVAKTWIEFHPDGALVIGIKGKHYTLVDDDDQKHVLGNEDVVVDGDGTHKTKGRFSRSCKSYEQISMGQWKIDATGDANMQAANLNATFTTQATVKAPTVNLGPGAAPGNVITTITHPFDFITGIPVSGTPFVKAG